MGIGTARAKLLLFGEHAAVYGHPAVGFSLPWELTARHTPGPAWVFPGLGPLEPGVRALVDRLVGLGAGAGLGLPVPGTLEFTSEIPLGTGFGSSGALCAALVNLFFPGLPLDEKDRFAWEAEKQFHGTPSGIDTALALRKGWWALETSTRPVTAAPLPDPGLILVTGALVRASDTKGLVGNLGRRREAGDPVVIQTLADLGRFSARAVLDLKAGLTGEIPGLVRAAREGLRTLGLETPDLTAVIDRGLGCPGALGGKLSGAGGGGAFVLVFENRDFASRALPVIGAAVPPGAWTMHPRIT